MTRLLHGLVFIGAVGLLAAPAIAAAPTVTVYFDEALTMQSVDRLSPGQHTLYIAAEGFDEPLTAIEYRIVYPPGMTWIADVDVPVVKIGTTADGIAQAWGRPFGGTSRVVIAKSVVQWDPPSGSGFEVAVRPHPASGFVRGTVAPDHRLVEAEGQESYVGSSDRSPAGGSTPALYGANPNPFNPATRVTYWVPASAYVRLTIYDVSGRLVTTLVDDRRERGEQTVEWRAGDLPSGVYFCRLEVDDFTANKKLVLFK